MAPTHSVDFEPVPIAPHSALCLEAGRVHQFDAQAAYEGKVLVFTEAFFGIAPDDISFLRHSGLFNSWRGTANINVRAIKSRLQQCFSDIAEELTVPQDKHSHALLQNRVAQVLLLINRQVSHAHVPEKQADADLYHFLEFRNLLELEYPNQKMVRNYAHAIHVTDKKLNQLTQKFLGKTAKLVIHERVILEAKRMLVHDKQSIKEIAFALGFDEPTNFIKYFRLHRCRSETVILDDWRVFTLNGLGFTFQNPSAHLNMRAHLNHRSLSC